MNNNMNRGGRSYRQGYGGRGRNGFGGRGHGRTSASGSGRWNDQGRGRGRRGRGGVRGGGYTNYSNNSNGGSYIHNIGISGNPSSTSFAVAVQGCSHGELDSIYEAIDAYRRRGREVGEEGGGGDDRLAENSNSNDNPPPRSHNKNNVDVLLCCGDVQTLRNVHDFHSLAVPAKYKTMGDFHAYYSGQKVAPILTIMIGGNHEASNYLQELHYGGWVAPNIYYLGAAGVVNLCKTRKGENDGDEDVVSVLRIAGISGIYKSNHFTLGRYEMPPYDNDSLRSVYHTREVDVRRMRAMVSSSASSKSSTTTPPRRTLDIMITHDWPRGIAHHGNVSQLLQQKPFFRQEVEQNELGSPAHEDLLYALKPRYWFAAHLHVKFEALVRHDDNGGEDGILQTTSATDVIETTSYSEKPDGSNATTTFTPTGPSAVNTTVTTEFIGMESNDGICPTPGDSNVESLTDQMTRFLSLDKCLPKRRHIQITHVEPSSSRVAVASPMEGGAASNCSSNDPWLEYDATWLAILRRTHGWTKRTRSRVVVPNDVVIITKAEEEDVTKRFELHRDDGDVECSSTSYPLTIPQNFVMTTPPFDPTTGNRTYGPPPSMIGNPQTDRLLSILELDHQITVPFVSGALYQSSNVAIGQPLCVSRQLIPSAAMYYNRTHATNIRGFEDENEIDLDDDLHENKGLPNDACIERNQTTTASEGNMHHDPGEIELDELEDDDGAADDTVVCFVPPPSYSAKKPRTNS